jgi:hypothetical protein
MSPVPGSQDSFSGSIKITADMPGGTYYPSNVFITGGSGLTTIGDPNDMSYRYGETRLTINNPSVPIVAEPQLISYKLSSHQLYVGQNLAVTAKIDTKSVPCKIFAQITSKNPKYFAGKHYVQAEMTNTGGSLYSGDIFIPYDSYAGEYCLDFFATDMQGNGLWLSVPDDFYMTGEDDIRYLKDGDVTVSPVLTFSGTDNEAILQGQPFDAAAGVRASNIYTGDITDKMEIKGGNIDTGVPGLYLVKYIVKDTVYIDGNANLISYTDYRWIGITELMPEAPAQNGDIPLAITDGSMAVGASNSDVSVKRDGQEVAFANSYTTPGVYTVSENDTASFQGAVFQSKSDSAAGGSGEWATAVIDRTGPALTAAWGKSGKSIVVTVKAADVAGVAQTKYKAGSCSLADCKNNGTAFSNAFTVPGYGAYTLYAKDKLGNESVKAVMVSSSSADFAYLSSVGLSAGTLSRAFTPKTYSYKIALGENQPGVTLTPAKEWDGAAMTINGKAVSSYTVSLANGKTATVKVQLKYGKTAKTYTFSVTRAKSTDNSLASLTATAGKFDKVFSPGVTGYTLTLDEKTGSATVKAAVQNKLAKASPASVKVTLKNGQSKTLKFTVKAQSGAKKTYTVTVVRAKSTSTALKYLKTDSSKYPITPAFQSGVTSYAVTLPANKSRVTISAKAVDSLTSVTVDGRKASKTLALKNGQSVTVKVTVTAQSGAKKEYEITVKRL